MGQSQGRQIVVTDEVKLDHFKLLRVVGKGAFGKVRIVERKDTGLTFALKYIRKDEVVRTENVRNIVRERRMLEHLNHPFLCNLRYSFQDYDYIYLVVDLMSGGDLRFHISRKVFHESAVRFWIAELGCALRYIHKQGIVHRDVKPDNVLLDIEGHVHLADFNVASDLTAGKKLTSKSGTMAYLAPEVYEGKGYRHEVDWWSLGVLFYECMYNRRPFDATTHDELAAQIKAANPRYPRTKPPIETSCTSCIQSLMCKSLYDRIGANSFETFASHPFFINAGMDFNTLEKRQARPVFRPSSEKTNFDATYDLEELLLEEAPLEARTRNTKLRGEVRADATPQERRTAELHKMIEQLFEPFDYTHASFDKFAGAAGEDPVLPPDQSLSAEAAHDVHVLVPSDAAHDASPDEAGTGSPPLTSQLSIPGGPQSVPSNDDSPAGSYLPPLLHLQGQPQNLQQAPTSAPQGQSRPQAPRVDSSGLPVPAGPMLAQPAPILAPATTKSKAGKKGFLGILSNKKSKDAQPRKTENGVLGKGARQILAD